MRIAVMGAGGLGGYIGARLAEAGEDVAFIARGAHLAAMGEDGLRIASPYGDLHLAKVVATATPAELGTVDVVLFTVKLWDAEQAAAALTPLVGPETRVITLQNGIDSIGFISRHVPRSQVIGGLSYIPAVISAPGIIRNVGGSKRTVIDGDRANEITMAFVASLSRAVGVDAEVTESIDRLLWEKFVRMSATAASTGLLRATIGPILAHPETRAFLRQLVEEGVAIAAATGNPVGGDFAEETMAFFESFPGAQRSSMAEDLERGRRLELPWLSGRIHTLGMELGVPTPAHTAAYRALVLHALGTPGA